MMSFCTSIHCMDGRIQESVLQYLKQTHGALYVDVITEPGPNRILAEREDTAAIESIRRRVDVSLEKHGSKLIVISGHHDCAGNPVTKAEQLEQIRSAHDWLKETYPHVQVEQLWINSLWQVERV